MSKTTRNPFRRVLESPTMSRSQIRAREELEDVLEGMMRWHGKTYDELKDDELFLVAYQDFVKEMTRAIRVGLIDHPAVQEFIHTRRSLGSRDTLRRARSGVEKGVKRPMTAEDVYLRGEIIKLVQDHEQKTGERITQSLTRKLLIARKTLPKMAPQAFHKRLKRLKLLHYFPRRY